MTSKDTEKTNDSIPAGNMEQYKSLTTVGWSLFLIWLGIALLVQISMGVVLLGVGVIILGMQTARKYLGQDLEKPWLAVGLVFTLGGAWELLEVKLPLIPLVLIAAAV